MVPVTSLRGVRVASLRGVTATPWSDAAPCVLRAQRTYCVVARCAGGGAA